METEYSVWGAIQDKREIAPGITLVRTASHGGFILSPERNAQVREQFPDFRPFGGHERSYEEDRDWAIVVATFPDHFESREVYLANNTIRNRPDYYKTGKSA